MHKRAILALLLALTLVLTGCNLVVKDAAVDAATEIVRLGDTVYTKEQVLNMVDNQLYYNYQNSYYMYYFGLGDLYDPTSAANIAAVKDQVVEYLTEQAVVLERGKANGLDKMTEAEEAEIAEKADSDWHELLHEIQDAYFADTTLEEGDALHAALEASATDLGYSKADFESSARENKLAEKVRAQALESMPAPTEADYQAALDTKAASAKASYETSPSNYGAAVNAGNEVYYRPAGYRTVQQILVKFTDDDEASMTDLEAKVADAEGILDDLTQQAEASTETDLTADITAAESALDAAYAALEAKEAEAYAHLDATADEVLAKIAAGEDFAALAQQYSGDKDASGNVNNPNGYAVCLDMIGYDPVFVAGAMALEKVGDVSDKLPGEYGYYIVKYTADVPEGTVALDEVRATIEAEVLKTKQDEYYTAEKAKWVKDSKVKIDRNSLDN